MVKPFEVPEARALFAAVFLQYLVYGVLYMIEGCKYQKLNKELKEKNLA